MKKVIKDYSTRIEAEVARIALEVAGRPSVVVGVDMCMEGGTAGMKLTCLAIFVSRELSSRWACPYRGGAIG
jgi:hypothetical protein